MHASYNNQKSKPVDQSTKSAAEADKSKFNQQSDPEFCFHYTPKPKLKKLQRRKITAPLLN
jgi:hypothetical protein